MQEFWELYHRKLPEVSVGSKKVGGLAKTTSPVKEGRYEPTTQNICLSSQCIRGLRFTTTIRYMARLCFKNQSNEQKSTKENNTFAVNKQTKPLQTFSLIVLNYL